MARSGIEWTETTWNPTAGCTVLSPGCTNCYAMRMAGRLQAMGHEKYAATTRRRNGHALWTGRLNFDEKALLAPLQWRVPRRVFVNSMSDLFHEKVTDREIVQVWQVMAEASQHTYQVLTKRPERMAAMTRAGALQCLENVWLGTSVETVEYALRIDHLRSAAAAVRFLSFEPLLGSLRGVDLGGMDWAIVGGESGPKARPMQAQWVTEIRDACRRSGTAFFFKQWGGRNKKSTGRTLDGRTWDEYPAQTHAVA